MIVLAIIVWVAAFFIAKKRKDGIKDFRQFGITSGMVSAVVGTALFMVLPSGISGDSFALPVGALFSKIFLVLFVMGCYFIYEQKKKIKEEEGTSPDELDT